MLRIEKGGNIFYKDKLIDNKSINLKEFIIASLDIETCLGPGLTLDDLVHSFYESREFIYQFFSHEYEVVRAFSTIGKLRRGYKNVKISKKFFIEDGYFYSFPSVELIRVKETHEIVEKLAIIPVVLEENAILDISEGQKINIKTKFTLLDIMRAIFADFTDMLKKESAIATK